MTAVDSTPPRKNDKSYHFYGHTIIQESSTRIKLAIPVRKRIARPLLRTQKLSVKQTTDYMRIF